MSARAAREAIGTVPSKRTGQNALRAAARRPRVASLGRAPRIAAALAAHADVHAADRAAHPREAARGIRDDAAALRPDGAARAQSRRPQDGRALAPADGDRRQRHRHHRPARRRAARRARADRERPARVRGAPHAQGQARIRRDGRRARALGDRPAVRFGRGRAAAVVRAARPHQDDVAPARDRCGAHPMNADTVSAAMPMPLQPFRDYAARHFRWQCDAGGKVATITLDRPQKKNPLTFDSYAELRDLFRGLVYASDVKAIVVTGAGDNFCSGGDVHEIIGPLTKMTMPELLAFTRMTGDLVQGMRACPQPIVAAVDGVCAGAGAMVALASDFRVGSASARTAFLFVRVGLAGCDMGACTLLPRMIGHGRAAELLYTGRAMTADEGAAWGFFNRLVGGARLLEDAQTLARSLADGPAFAHAMTKKLLHQEWAMD